MDEGEGKSSCVETARCADEMTRRVYNLRQWAQFVPTPEGKRVEGNTLLSIRPDGRTVTGVFYLRASYRRMVPEPAYVLSVGSEGRL
jgi:hypothetical protein